MTFKRLIQKIRFSLKYRITLYEKIADYLDSKFPVEQTLAQMSKRYKKNKDYRYKILDEWKMGMTRGKKFSDAIVNQVPSEERILISSGENSSGGLQEGLREAIRLSSSMAKIKSVIIGGSSYPIVLMFMILGMISMFSTQVAPVFKTILAIELWPESGKALYELSTFIVQKWWILTLATVATVYVIVKSLPRWCGKTRGFADKFPPYSIYKSYQASSFLIALSAMMKSGISLNDALNRIREQGSPWLRSHIDVMLRKLRYLGTDYGKALDTGLLENEIAGDIQDYSQLSSFENAVYRIGEASLIESVRVIEVKMNVVKYIMMFAAAGTLMWFFSTSYLLQQEVAGNAGNPQAQVSSTVN